MEVEIKMGFKYQRLLGYFLGFILFYAPFALFQKIIFFAFTGKWQQLLFSHSDRAFTGWKVAADVASFYCLYRDLADSYFVFWSCILRQIMSCRSFYRVFKQSHTIKAADKLAYLYRDRSVSLWHAGRVCDIAIF